MGLQELLETLKKNEQKQIDDIWQATHQEAEMLRQQVKEAINEISQKQADQLAAACQKSRRSIISEAEIETRSKKLFAYQALEKTLRDAAVKQLPTLRHLHYDRVFALLVKELPEKQWDTVTVNPEDGERARTYFPQDCIRTDAAISGGLRAATADGRIIVDNTFEKRLERLWFRILPQLIAHIEKQYAEKVPAADI